MTPELEQAHRARVPYLEPAELGDSDGRRRREDDLKTLRESYATQTYVQDGSLRCPAPGETRQPDLDAPETRWLMTGWNPDGERYAYAWQVRANTRLRGRVLDAGGLVVGEGTAMAPTRAWVEDHLVVAGLPAAVAVRLAERARQPAVVALTGDVLTVVPTGLRDDVELVSLPSVVEVLPTTCPMRADDVPGRLCARRGGPWISASIHAAAIRDAHRRLLLDRLPCEPCANGTRPVLGAPGTSSSSGALAVASRYGGWVWT